MVSSIIPSAMPSIVLSSFVPSASPTTIVLKASSRLLDLTNDLDTGFPNNDWVGKLTLWAVIVGSFVLAYRFHLHLKVLLEENKKANPSEETELVVEFIPIIPPEDQTHLSYFWGCIVKFVKGRFNKKIETEEEEAKTVDCDHVENDIESGVKIKTDSQTDNDDGKDVDCDHVENDIECGDIECGVESNTDTQA